MNLSTQLRHRVMIQVRAPGEDEAGQPIETWQDFAPAWADIRNLNGLEAVKGGAQTSTVKTSIRIRYRTGLNAGMRVLHGTKVYLINAILPDEVGKVHMDLACEAIE